MTILKMIGVIIGFAGVVIMIGYDVLGGISKSIYGQLAAIGAAVSYSLDGIYGRRFSKLGVNPMVRLLAKSQHRLFFL